MTRELAIADPAGNITVFVLNPPADQAGRIAAARALLADPALGAEQVGFVISPEAAGGLWRLEMMGGEFCGNAARSFGLFLALRRGIRGAGELEIGVSGMEKPLRVSFDTLAGAASVEIPPPPPRRELPFRDQSLGVYDFGGISHAIAPGIPPGKEIFDEFRGIFEADCQRRGLPPPGALGLMFWEPEKPFMRPAVYVYGTGSLIFESSCGSGSAAMGLHLGESLRDGREAYAIPQPGGLIEVRVEKEAALVRSLSIGGPVKLRGAAFPE